MKESMSGPSCSRAEDLLAVLYGEASESETRNFQQHLSSCAYCSADFAAFGGVRQSVMAWRDDSLSFSGTRVTGHVVVESQPSALAALREFFNLSPLWLKGAVAFATLLFCALAFLAVARFRQTPRPAVANNEASPANLAAEVEARAQKRVQELMAAASRDTNDTGRQVSTPPEKKRVVPALTARDRPSTAFAKDTRRPLSKAEREQLAADLRLTATTEENDLDLLSDTLNRQDD